MATKKTWEWARRKALLAYRKALKAAEKDDWDGADCLIRALDKGCAFCDAVQEKSLLCSACPARVLCAQKPQSIAVEVFDGWLPSDVGLERLRLTIKQLEALDV